MSDTAREIAEKYGLHYDPPTNYRGPLHASRVARCEALAKAWLETVTHGVSLVDAVTFTNTDVAGEMVQILTGNDLRSEDDYVYDWDLDASVDAGMILGWALAERAARAERAAYMGLRVIAGGAR